jgi:hypothetical protein
MLNHFGSPHVYQVQYSNFISLDGKTRRTDLEDKVGQRDEVPLQDRLNGHRE